MDTGQSIGRVGAHVSRVVLAGPDTLHFSVGSSVSDGVRAKLHEEKEAAQSAEKANTAHCPEWLGAQVHPHGSRGGYAYLLETDDFSVKMLGKGIPHRPGLYVELRSPFLHTHPEGPRGACEEALGWLREQLLYDQDMALVQASCTFETVRLSRVDLHVDWQGDWVPTAELGEGLQFIKPARVTWHTYHDGATFTGLVFGSGSILARIYNKSLQSRHRHDDAYATLLDERNPDTFDPTQDVWRLEFQLRREGTTGFRLYTEPDAHDDETTIEAELAAEELPHLGTLPRFFRYQDALWRYLTTHWLRLVEDDGTANRSRWPLHPTWSALQDGYERLIEVVPLTDEAYTVSAAHATAARAGSCGACCSASRARLRSKTLHRQRQPSPSYGAGQTALQHAKRSWLQRGVPAMPSATARCRSGSSGGWAHISSGHSRCAIVCRCCSASLQPVVYYHSI